MLPADAIFVAGNRPYRPADVLAAADLRGDLAPALATVRAGRGAAPAASDGAAREALRRWRVERGLLAAEDVERWLRARGLTPAELSAFTSGQVPTGDAARAAYADLAFGGGFDRLALEAAQRAAVHAAWEAKGRRDPDEAALR